jgi:F-type H+-transporting ATPase subunit alpha
VETQAQNLSAYIPTNLISITDGQIYLNPRLFQEGVMPAVDIGESVSRVGGKTQFPAYREVASDLKLSYSQFEELENFARFGPRLDEETQQKLKRGHRVREVFKQPQYKPIPVAEQIAVLLSVTEGLLDSVALDKIDKAKKDIRRNMGEKLPEIYEKLQNGNKMEEQDKQAILQMVRETLSLKEQS